MACPLPWSDDQVSAGVSQRELNAEHQPLVDGHMLVLVACSAVSVNQDVLL